MKSFSYHRVPVHMAYHSSTGNTGTNESILIELGLEREIMGRVAKLKLEERYQSGHLLSPTLIEEGRLVSE